MQVDSVIHSRKCLSIYPCAASRAISAGSLRTRCHATARLS